MHIVEMHIVEMHIVETHIVETHAVRLYMRRLQPTLSKNLPMSMTSTLRNKTPYDNPKLIPIQQSCTNLATPLQHLYNYFITTL
jgi:hypothetical protein